VPVEVPEAFVLIEVTEGAAEAAVMPNFTPQLWYAPEIEAKSQNREVDVRERFAAVNVLQEFAPVKNQHEVSLNNLRTMRQCRRESPLL
jgi:hypothetical protein